MVLVLFFSPQEDEIISDEKQNVEIVESKVILILEVCMLIVLGKLVSRIRY